MRRPAQSAPRTHQQVLRTAARRVAVTGGALVLTSLAAGALSGGAAWAGALWGAGAGALLTAITATCLWIPWDRYPLLAASGVMLSFAGKVLVMVTLVLLLGAHRESIEPMWFFAPLALVLLAVTGVEIVTLAAGRTPTVEPDAGSRQ